MDLNQEKVELTKLILATEDLSILKAIRALFPTEKPKDFWNNYSYEQKKEIEAAAKQLGDGSDLTSHDF